jgi:hypothetical protein
VIAGILISMLAFITPAAVRGDIRAPLQKRRQRPTPASGELLPKPPPTPRLAGSELPRPLNVVVAGMALAAAVAGAGVLLFRARGKLRGISGWGAIVAAGLILTGASALAYWSYSTEKYYEAVNARQQADYNARPRNDRGRGPGRPSPPVDAPVANASSAGVRP